jgi:hypothetical protein
VEVVQRGELRDEDQKRAERGREHYQRGRDTGA